MDPNMQQLTTGAIVALLILERVFLFLKQKKNGNGKTAGDQSVEVWQAQQAAVTTTVVTGVINASVIPILARLTEIMVSLERSSTRHGEEMLKVQYAIKEVLSELGRARE